MTESIASYSGGCHCGSVRYEVTGALRDVVNCHCSMCLRLHGTFGAYTKITDTNFSFVEDRGLTWYDSSNTARRGFCRECGANLFWQPLGFATTSIAAGSLDQAPGLKTVGHIYTAEKGDFYEICDDLPRYPGSASGALDTAGA